MARADYVDGRQWDLISNEEQPGLAIESIQPHGAVIVIKEPELTILQASANTRPHFGFEPEELLNHPLALLLGDTEVRSLRDQYLSKDLHAAPHYLPVARIGKGNKLFEGSIHRRDGLLILEFEPRLDNANTRIVIPASLINAIEPMRRSESVGKACQTVVDEARRFTDFDRVMVYQFKADGSGTVIAESLGGNFKSCLGFHFPPSNITQQARAIYRSGRTLIKVDVNDQPVYMIPTVSPGGREPLDLSYAVTRDLAPAYNARLKRTGVTALMFIPITKNDRLWGLIMFYNHTGPKYVPRDGRMACELLAHYLSLWIAAKERVNNNRYLARVVRLNAELERSNIELDSFACAASHGLKEPLRGIHSYSTFLMEDYADKLGEAGMEKLRTMGMLAQRMEALIDSLLHFSRVGLADLAMREVDLEEIVDKTLEIIAPRLHESGVEIRRPRRLPIVRADHARVGEIFHNLIVNAIKYNDKPLKWVEIGWQGEETRRRGDAAAERQEETGSEFPLPASAPRPFTGSSFHRAALSPPRPVIAPPVFYVRDNGIGIPERHYETVFGIFRRLHGRNEFGGGVGAGLTIVKKIIDRHNGRIWIESNMGAGTTVYFTLG